jgi:hypothetical protein
VPEKHHAQATDEAGEKQQDVAEHGVLC